ncbi:MAG: hypothetical protein ABIS20_24660 [Thermoanaerobaculia bacterium]
MKNVSLWLCCCLLSLPVAVRAQDPPPASVEDKLQELDQKIRVLDRKIEIDKEAAAEKAKTAGQVVAQIAEGEHDLLVLGAPLPGRDGRIALGGFVGRLLPEVAQLPVLIVRSPEAVS